MFQLPESPISIFRFISNPIFLFSVSSQYNAVHVRQGFAQHVYDNGEMYKGRDIQYYDTIEEALSSVEGNDYPVILLHTGVYSGEWLYIDTPVCIVGAGEYVLMLSFMFSSEMKSSKHTKGHLCQKIFSTRFIFN